jgi:hypothetical protein
VDAAYYDSTGVVLDEDRDYQRDVRVDYELFRKIYQS